MTRVKKTKQMTVALLWKLLPSLPPYVLEWYDSLNNDNKMWNCVMIVPEIATFQTSSYEPYSRSILLSFAEKKYIYMTAWHISMSHECNLLLFCMVVCSGIFF